MITSIKDIMVDALDRLETQIELEISGGTIKLRKGSIFRIKQHDKPKPTEKQKEINDRVNKLISEYQSAYENFHGIKCPAITAQDRLAIKQQLLRYDDSEASLLIRRYIMSPDLEHLKDRRPQHLGRAMSILTKRRN